MPRKTVNIMRQMKWINIYNMRLNSCVVTLHYSKKDESLSLTHPHRQQKIKKLLYLPKSCKVHDCI